MMLLLPCLMQDCGAIAVDSTGTDISSSIVVVDVTPCATGDECPACAITFAAAGLCQPGAYLYLYRFVVCIFTHSQRYAFVGCCQILLSVTESGTLQSLNHSRPATPSHPLLSSYTYNATGMSMHLSQSAICTRQVLLPACVLAHIAGSPGVIIKEPLH